MTIMIKEEIFSPRSTFMDFMIDNMLVKKPTKEEFDEFFNSGAENSKIEKSLSIAKPKLGKYQKDEISGLLTEIYPKIKWANIISDNAYPVEAILFYTYILNIRFDDIIITLSELNRIKQNFCMLHKLLSNIHIRDNHIYFDIPIDMIYYLYSIIYQINTPGFMLEIGSKIIPINNIILTNISSMNTFKTQITTGLYNHYINYIRDNL